MPSITVTKDLGEFQCAHWLSKHEGACANIHGHSYKVGISLSADVSFEFWSSGANILVDFCKFDLIRSRVKEMMDHRLLINRNVLEKRSLEDVITIMEGDPSAENIAFAILIDFYKFCWPDIWEDISSSSFKDSMSNFDVTVHVQETSSSGASVTVPVAQCKQIQDLPSRW